MSRETRGFTLVELLVVVAILMVIAAIGLPYYVSATQRAHEAGAVAYLRSLQTAQETYRLAHRQYADRFSDLRPYLSAESTAPRLPHPSGTFWVTTAFAEPFQGQGGTPPGQGGTPPGQGGTPPGQGGAPPGQGGAPPGQGGTPPGQGGNPPTPDSTVNSLYIFYLTRTDPLHWQCTAEPLRNRLDGKYFFTDDSAIIHYAVGALANFTSPQL